MNIGCSGFVRKKTNNDAEFLLTIDEKKDNSDERSNVQPKCVPDAN